MDDPEETIEVSEFFVGKNVLITGATGFLGKVLLEKLLRDASGVAKVFLLIRPCPRRNTVPVLRVKNDITSTRLFDSLRSAKGGPANFDKWIQEKVLVIEGDLDKDNLGISTANMKLILDQVDLIYHLAASQGDGVELLEIGLRRNVQATLQLLSIAKKMKHLQAFMHISSAHVNSFLTGSNVKVEERIYPSGIDADALLHQMTSLKPKKLEKQASTFMKSYPNMHVFTKSLTESLLTAHKDEVPLVIVRPAILGATYASPFPGWVDSLSIAGTLFVYTGLGIVKFFPGNPNLTADIVPADMVVNLLIAATAVLGSDQKKLRAPAVPPILHAATSNSHPLKWGYCAQTMARYWQRNGPKKKLSPASVYMIQNYPLYRSQFLLKYEAPAFLYSAMSRIFKSEFHKKQADKLHGVVDKCYKLNQNLRHFVDNEWVFTTNTANFIRDQVSDKDLDIFDFDWVQIDWHLFVNYYCWGLQRFVLREDVPEPKPRDLKLNRMLSVDVDGRNATRKLFRDIEFALTNSRNVPHISLSQQRKIRREVLNSVAVREAIKQVSEQKSIPEDTIQKQARDIMMRMSSKMQMPWLRMLAWFFRKIWRAIYQGFDINEANLVKIPELLKKGPVILIPSHRSYIDFLITSYILFAFGIPVPFIAAGEDFLNLSFVSNLLRFGGAFFLRRTFRGDILYNAIFNEYVQRLTLLGWTMEFFIEGTRSRSGKLLQPKLGLLGIITDVFFDKRLEEITFVPININYEKVIEDEAYTNEWLGNPKKKENLENLLKAAQILQHDFGRISFKVCEPISLKEYTEDFIKDNSKAGATVDPFTNTEDKKQLNIALAHQIIYDINDGSVWSPLAIVASILLTYRYGIFRTQLVEKFEWVVNEILRRGQGHDDWIIEHPAAKLVADSLVRFEAHIEDRKDMIAAPEKTGVLVMAFYRNRLMHIFVREAFFMASFAALGGDEDDSDDALVVSRATADDVRTGAAIDKALAQQAEGAASTSNRQSVTTKSVNFEQINASGHFLVDLLGKEFVYKPHPDEDEAFDAVMEDLINQKVLERDPTAKGSVRLLKSEHAKSVLHYFAGLIWPFIDTYWVACLVLYILRPTATKIQPLLLRMQWMSETLIGEGKVQFYETCSVETLRNALAAFQKMGVVKQDGDMVALSKPFADNGAIKLKDLLVKIGKLRRKSLDNNEIGLPKSVIEDFPIRAKL